MEQTDSATLQIMRLIDGELSAAATVAEIERCRRDPATAALLTSQAAAQSLLEAAFRPADGDGSKAARVIDATLASRHRRTDPGLFRRLMLPLAASVLTAVILGTGSVLVAEHRSEAAIARMVAAIAHDRQLSQSAFVEALDRHLSGMPVGWRNPASGSSGSITPVRTFRGTDGRWCREYEQRLDGPVATERMSGIACRAGNGWQVEMELPGDV